MIANFYFKPSRRIRILILFIIIILLAYFILRFLAVEPRNIPKEFLGARQEASLIAQDIVAISNQSTDNLAKIAAFDQERKYTEALLSVSQELDRNQQAREKAVKLSVQLEMMAKNLAQISPASAGQIALQAVSSETALISRLITYNDYLAQLLGVLQGKFLGKSDGDKIPELISKINEEAQAINELDQKFNNLMKEFDSNF